MPSELRACQNVYLENHKENLIVPWENLGNWRHDAILFSQVNHQLNVDYEVERNTKMLMRSRFATVRLFKCRIEAV
jgi:hypothetical protein